MRRLLACFLTARIHPVREERDSQYTACVQSKDPDHHPFLSQPRGSLTVTLILYLFYTIPSSCPQSLPPIIFPRSSRHQRKSFLVSELQNQLALSYQFRQRLNVVQSGPLRARVISELSFSSLCSLDTKDRALRKRPTRGSQTLHCLAA